MPETKLKFPKGFLIGAASAAHQVEGNNINSDWWYWEQQGKVPKSGDCTDHYNRFDEDFKLAADLGLNSMRISIEWARIEPKEGQWDGAAVEHYRKVLKSMKSHGLTRVVTLWHWTLPQWLSSKGGFENPESVHAFARFTWFIVKNLGSEVDLWMTLNEPEIHAGLGYQQGVHPPFKKDLYASYKVLQNLIKAHKIAFHTIKQTYPKAMVGIAKNSSYYEPYKKNILNRMVVFFADRISNHYFLEKIKNHLDFIGVNYYFYNRIHVDLKGYHEMNFNFGQGQLTLKDSTDRSDMGWLLYPKGLYYLLLDLKKYKKPIYITENGLADAADSRRGKYLREVLTWVQKAIAQGVDVRGYLHWALTDNYEWTQGFGPRFGLIEIDYTTQARKVRSSAAILKEIEYNG